jgi:hypothetical protein
MKASIVAGSLLSGLFLVALPMQAQQVSADVIVHGGPVAGRVVVGDGYSTYLRAPVVYRRPAPRRVVVVERPAPRVILVERSHRYRSAAFWRRHGFRPVVLYYADGRYFDRPVWHRGGYAREVIVYERDGRFYRDWDEDRRGWDDRYDREDRYDRDGHERDHHWDD